MPYPVPQSTTQGTFPQTNSTYQQYRQTPQPPVTPQTPLSAGVGSLPQQHRDYSFVSTKARIAIYDDMLSEPRVVEINPAPTADFIGNLSSKIYEYSMQMGGTIAFSIIQQVTENFIHAQFSEIVVSIFNSGKTIRFADQGPGFKNKERALLPGFTSADAEMKKYIKGVGSGLPSVKEWLAMAGHGGTITIEDNLNGGSVVTISVDTDNKKPHAPFTPYAGADSAQTGTPSAGYIHTNAQTIPVLTEKDKIYLGIMAQEGPTRITDFVKYTDDASSSVFNQLENMKTKGLVEITDNKLRKLTAKGEDIAYQLGLK